MTDYTIHTDIKFGALEFIDVDAMIAACDDEWFTQALCRVNDCVVRMAVVKGEFHWHHHDDEDEFFYCVQGTLTVDFNDESVTLKPNQGITVPKGVRHRTRAPERTVMLMVSGHDVTPTGD